MNQKDVKFFGDGLIAFGVLLFFIPVMLALLLVGPGIINFAVVAQTLSVPLRILIFIVGLVISLCATGGMITFIADVCMTPPPRRKRRKKGIPKM